MSKRLFLFIFLLLFVNRFSASFRFYRGRPEVEDMSVVQRAAAHRASTMAAKKLIYPAADRNKEPILAILRRFIHPGSNQKLLEIASGSGQHLAHFAPHFPQVTFYPSECEARLLESISAHTSDLCNVSEPSLIDVSLDCREWQCSKFPPNSLDYVYCANMIHISPYRCTIGLFRNAGYLLKNGGNLFTYGAYAIDGTITPESNVRFDESLRSQNPEWGLRDLRQLEALANECNLWISEIFDMPANNKTIVWRKNE